MISFFFCHCSYLLLSYCLISNLSVTAGQQWEFMETRASRSGTGSLMVRLKKKNALQVMERIMLYNWIKYCPSPFRVQIWQSSDPHCYRCGIPWLGSVYHWVAPVCYQCYTYFKESGFAFFNFSVHFLSFSHLKVESLWQALGMTVPGLEREKDDILEVLNWLATQWA